MIRPEGDEETVLARARRALSPSDLDAQRVSHALQAALQAGDLAGGVSAAGKLQGWPMRLVLAATIAGTSGALGYWAGWRARGRVAPLAQVAPPVVVAASASSGAEAIARPAEPARADGVLAPAVAPPPRAQRHQQAPPRMSRVPSSPESLAREVEALRAVERALREGSPGLALALLRELDRAVPGGKLEEERSALAAIARCTAGVPAPGVDEAAAFARRYPDSVYGERVDDACNETDLAGSGNTPAGRLPR